MRLSTIWFSFPCVTAFSPHFSLIKTSQYVWKSYGSYEYPFLPINVHLFVYDLRTIRLRHSCFHHCTHAFICTHPSFNFKSDFLPFRSPIYFSSILYCSRLKICSHSSILLTFPLINLFTSIQACLIIPSVHSPLIHAFTYPSIHSSVRQSVCLSVYPISHLFSFPPIPFFGHSPKGGF